MRCLRVPLGVPLLRRFLPPPLLDRRVRSLVADPKKRHVIAGVVKDIDYFESTPRMVFVLQDQSGGMIPVVALYEAYDHFKPVIKPGKTVKLSRVVVKESNPAYRQGLEIRIWPDTPVEECEPLTLHNEFETDFEDCLAKHHFANLVGVVVEVDEEVRTMGGSGKQYRNAKMKDTKGFAMPLRLLDTETAVAVGDVMGVSGRLAKSEGGSGHSMFVFETVRRDPPPELVEAYASICANHDGSEMASKKRPREEVTTVADVKTLTVGDVVEVKGVVRTLALVAIKMTSSEGKEKARFKRTMTIVDSSMACIEVGLFGDTPTIGDDISVRSIVAITGKVSGYHTRSLTTNAVVQTEDAELDAWWKSNKDGVFDELSVDA